MSSPTIAQARPPIDRVYQKTAAGRHEVVARGAGLNARQRAALIMLDGQRDASMLESTMPADQVAPVLEVLMALELIAVVAPAPGPAAVDATRLSAIKAELIGAAEQYLGAMSASVVARVRAAGDETQLLRVLGHWHMAMQDAKHGKQAAALLLEKARTALQ